MSANIEPAASRDAVDKRGWVGPLVTVIVVAGLAVVATHARRVDVAECLDALARVGVFGFAGYCAWFAGVYLLLGAGWLAMLPGQPARSVWLMWWARAVREAVSDLLPFAQIGGAVVAFRLLIRRGLPRPAVYASFTADLGVEMVSQLVFTVICLSAWAFAPSRLPALSSSDVVTTIGALAGACVALLGAQRALVAFGPALAARWSRSTSDGDVDAPTIATHLRAAYARPARLAAGFAANLAAWFASAAGTWLVLGAAGFDPSLAKVLGLESLVAAVRAVAFIVPAGIGVQEAAYAVLAPSFGLPLEAALLIALIKRARDVALGVPTILVWQLGELQHWLGTRRPRPDGDPHAAQNASSRVARSAFRGPQSRNAELKSLES